jgi:hypothetical protein
MSNEDLLRVREYYIVVLVSARRKNDSDTIEICLDWLVALTGEMRIRGNPMRSIHDTPVMAQ